jgi:hypothetical protein
LLNYLIKTSGQIDVEKCERPLIRNDGNSSNISIYQENGNLGDDIDSSARFLWQANQPMGTNRTEPHGAGILKRSLHGD